jgi:hypothetical protein
MLLSVPASVSMIKFPLGGTVTENQTSSTPGFVPPQLGTGIPEGLVAPVLLNNENVQLILPVSTVAEQGLSFDGCAQIPVESIVAQKNNDNNLILLILYLF